MTATLTTPTTSRDAFHLWATQVAGYWHRPLGPAAGAWDAFGRRYYSDAYVRSGREITVTVTDAASGVIDYAELWTLGTGTVEDVHPSRLGAILADWSPVSLVKSYV
jgi:hypothetical protein